MTMKRNYLSLLALPILMHPTMAAEKPKPLFVSSVVTSRTPGHAVDIDVDLKGARSLFLVLDETGDGHGCDWADWVEPRLIGPKGELKLTDLKWKAAFSGWGNARVNLNASGGKLVVGGKPVPYGIGTHAPSTIEFVVPEGYTRFKARGGLDHGGISQRGGNTSSVKFQIWNTKPGNAASGQEVEVPL